MNEIDAAYRKFCRTRFPLPTERQVADLEQRISVSFPEDYRDFVLEYNGGFFNEPLIIPPDEDCPLVALRHMNGIGASHPVAELGSEADLAIFDDNDPPEILPVGYTTMGYLVLLIIHPENRGWILLRTFDQSFFLGKGIEEFFGLLEERGPD
jgi:hypothetical protein